MGFWSCLRSRILILVVLIITIYATQLGLANGDQKLRKLEELAPALRLHVVTRAIIHVASRLSSSYATLLFAYGATPTPTTFVQADATTFRELVQKLTGAAEDATEKLPVTLPARFSGRSSDTGDVVRKLQTAFNLIISAIQSLVTPLGSDPLLSGQFPGSGSESPSSPATAEEEKARAEKGSFFKPSPLTH